MNKYKNVDGVVKLPLYGFNNLTKSLTFNIYDISYARNRADQLCYIEYIDELYCSERLAGILQGVANIIGARVLNVASQDYDPQGASVTMLVEEGFAPLEPERSVEPDTDLQSKAVVAHLDKSHITVHTYPEQHPDEGISTFRADIDVATCGQISPLQALDYLIDSFESDILTIDYRVRGFTRTMGGEKLFMDHEIESIRDFIDPEILKIYTFYDENQPGNNSYHTRLKAKDLALEEYLYEGVGEALTEAEQERIKVRLEREMDEIFRCQSS